MAYVHARTLLAVLVRRSLEATVKASQRADELGLFDQAEQLVNLELQLMHLHRELVQLPRKPSPTTDKHQDLALHDDGVPF